MKSKKIIVLFLIFLILILPLEQVHAIAIIPIALGLIGTATLLGRLGLLGKVGDKIADTVLGIVNFLLGLLFGIIYSFLWLLTELLVFLINSFSGLDPFYEFTKDGEKFQSPAAIVWNVIKGLAYIILVFSALAAAYEWLFGDDVLAKRRIFNIILVALIISFTFAIIKEIFLIVRSFEKGLTGVTFEGQKGKGIGDLMQDTLWQENPLSLMTDITQEKGVKDMARVVGYIFAIVMQMLILIILAITLALFVARYIMIIFLTGTSPIAVASLVFPEIKGPFAKVMSEFRFFETWLEKLVKWLLVIPIFVVLVLLGNILKENTLEQIDQNISWVNFVILLFTIGTWYALSIKIAINLSGKVGALAKSLSSGLLLLLGGLATRGLWGLAKPGVGKFLAKTGEKLQQKVGAGGPFGWRSWVGQKIAKRMKGAGEKMIKERYEYEAEWTKSQIASISEQLRKETDQSRIQQLNSQLINLAQRYKDNSFMIKNIGEAIAGMDHRALAKIVQDSAALQSLTGANAPQEIREAVIRQINNLRGTDLMSMLRDNNWRQNFGNLDAEIQRSFADRISQALNTGQALELLSDANVRDYILGQLQPGAPLRSAIDSITGGFVEALAQKNIENISSALAGLDKSVWGKYSRQIHDILNSQLEREDLVKTAILETIRGTNPENRGEIIRAAYRDLTNPLRNTFGNFSPAEMEEIKNLLTPTEQAVFDALNKNIIIIPSRR